MRYQITERAAWELNASHYARSKFPSSPTKHHAMAVITEEFLELQREVFEHGTPEKIHAEAIQLAVVALRMAFDTPLEST